MPESKATPGKGDAQPMPPAQEVEQAKKSKKKDRKKRRDASAKDGSSGADAEPAGSADLDAQLPADVIRGGDVAPDVAAEAAVAAAVIDGENAIQPAAPTEPSEAADVAASADRSSEDELVEAMAAAQLSRSGSTSKPVPARPAKAQAGGADAAIAVGTRKDQQQQQQQQQGQRAPPQGKQQRATNGTGVTNGKRLPSNGRAASVAGGGTSGGGSGTVTPRGDSPSQPSSKASTPRVKGGAADRLRGGPADGGSRLGTPSKPSGSGTPSKPGSNTPSKPAANGRYLMVGPLAGNDAHGPGSRHGSRHASMEGVSPVASPTNGRRQPYGAAVKGQQPPAQTGRPQHASPATGRQSVASSGTAANGDAVGYQPPNPAPRRTPAAATPPRAAPSAPNASPSRPLQAAPLAAGTSPRVASRAGAPPGRPSAPQAATQAPGWQPMASSHPAEHALLVRQRSEASVEQRLEALPDMHRTGPAVVAASAATGSVPVLPSLFSSQQVDWSFSAPNRSDGNVAEHMPLRWGSNGGVAGSADSAPSLPAGFAPLGGGLRPLFAGPPVRPLVGFAPDQVRAFVPPALNGSVSQPPHLSAPVPVSRTSGAFDVSGRMQHSLDSLQSSFGSPASADISSSGTRQPLDGGALQQQLRQLWADDRPPAASIPSNADPLRDAFKGSLWGSANVWG